MFQNHMMELLSLVATEPPSQITAEILRDKKAELFHSLRPFELKDLNSNLVLGQYQAGEIQGERVPGYREEPGVDPDSLTPTYALMRVFVDNWRWQGVPFYIISGKRLRQKVTRIDIQFKPVPHTMFRSIFSGNVTANRLTIGVYPQEGIFLSIQAMKPSAEFSTLFPETRHSSGAGTGWSCAGGFSIQY
jgi:glucose-6-phosphate 1-dehydrogenase